MMMPNENQQQPEAPGGDAGQAVPENPILEAVRTIAVYIAGLSEKGDPSAPALQQIMAQFVQTLQQGAGQEAGPPQASGAEQQQQGMGQAQAPGGGRGVNPMLGNMAGGARSMNRGQVAVI